MGLVCPGYLRKNNKKPLNIRTTAVPAMPMKTVASYSRSCAITPGLIFDTKDYITTLPKPKHEKI